METKTFLEHLSFWHNKSDDDCIGLASNENGVDAEQALLNILERDFCTDINNNLVETLKINNNMGKIGTIKIIEDLSYSGLGNLIQGDVTIAAETLVTLALEKEPLDELIKEVTKELDNLKTRKASLIEASKLILKHIKKESPLAVQRDGFIVVCTDTSISIERNVIQ